MRIFIFYFFVTRCLQYKLTSYPKKCFFFKKTFPRIWKKETHTTPDTFFVQKKLKKNCRSWLSSLLFFFFPLPLPNNQPSENTRRGQQEREKGPYKERRVARDNFFSVFFSLLCVCAVCVSQNMQKTCFRERYIYIIDRDVYIYMCI